MSIDSPDRNPSCSSYNENKGATPLGVSRTYQPLSILSDLDLSNVKYNMFHSIHLTGKTKIEKWVLAVLTLVKNLLL